MGSRFPSHKLSGGLYVSGRPEQPKEKAPTMTAAAAPYTGGDIKKSGELGKMFVSNAPSRSTSFGGPTSHSGQLKKTNSGPLNKHGEPMKKSSGNMGPASRQNSGPITLPKTGLITSGPLSSTGGPLESMSSMKRIHSAPIVKNNAVTYLSQDTEYSFWRSFPKMIFWSIILLFVMGFIAGGFIIGAVHNPVLLVVVGVLFGAVVAVFTWNTFWGRRAIIGYVESYPLPKLREAEDGQFVKVSGVVTCGNVPLETTFQRVSRCVYTSTSLYEYRGWDSKAANPTHRRFTWGLRSLERQVSDFYISDHHSGLRALVKTGYGARVTPYVDESIVMDIDPSNKDMSIDFVRWLAQRNLSSDDRIMRLKEGYIKEGMTVSVMGVVRRNENIIMIVPPPEPFSTGMQWSKCILPASLEGIVLRCDEASNNDVIPV